LKHAQRASAEQHSRKLEFKTFEEDEHHFKTCAQRSSCSWCKVIIFLRKFHSSFKILTDREIASEQFKMLEEKNKILANTSWLGKAHVHGRKDMNGEVFVGCIVCHAFAANDVRCKTNAFADFRCHASDLGKPHVLLRHATRDVHKKAVAAFIGQGGTNMFATETSVV